MFNRERRGSRGFTLVEVLVAMAIFLVASMGLLPLLLTNLQVNRGNGLHGEARRLAGAAMTELQVADYASLPLLPTEPYLAGEIEVDLQVEPGQPFPGQSRLTVTARWQQQGRSHSYRLQAIRSAP